MEVEGDWTEEPPRGLPSFLTFGSGPFWMDCNLLQSGELQGTFLNWPVKSQLEGLSG